MTSITRNTTRFGGDERTRTADPLLAKQVLYQLSYVPSLIRGTPRDLSQQTARGTDGPPAIERPPQFMRNECRGRSRPEVATSIALSA